MGPRRTGVAALFQGVDLYVIHRFDYGTTIEETIEALHDVVKAGKVRYLGASKPHHLDDALKALDVTLDAETVKYLEEPYRPKPVAAHE